MPSVRSHDLTQMTPQEREVVLRNLVAHAEDDPEVVRLALTARLRVYEERYELPSSDVAAALTSGRLRETADVSAWLFWIAVRDRLGR